MVPAVSMENSLTKPTLTGAGMLMSVRETIKMPGPKAATGVDMVFSFQRKPAPHGGGSFVSGDGHVFLECELDPQCGSGKPCGYRVAEKRKGRAAPHTV